MCEIINLPTEKGLLLRQNLTISRKQEKYGTCPEMRQLRYTPCKNCNFTCQWNHPIRNRHTQSSDHRCPSQLYYLWRFVLYCAFSRYRSIIDLFMGKPKLLTFWQVRILYSAFKLNIGLNFSLVTLSSSLDRCGIHGFFFMKLLTFEFFA